MSGAALRRRHRRPRADGRGAGDPRPRIRPRGVILFRRNIENAGAAGRGSIARAARARRARISSSTRRAGRSTGCATSSARRPPFSRPRARGPARRAGAAVGREAARASASTWTWRPSWTARVPGARSAGPRRALRLRGPRRDRARRPGRFSTGLHSQGVGGCLKHFPGLGRAALDTHQALPRRPGRSGRGARCDLAPFRRADGAGARRHDLARGRRRRRCRPRCRRGARPRLLRGDSRLRRRGLLRRPRDGRPGRRSAICPSAACAQPRGLRPAVRLPPDRGVSGVRRGGGAVASRARGARRPRRGSTPTRAHLGRLRRAAGNPRDHARRDPAELKSLA